MKQLANSNRRFFKTDYVLVEEGIHEFNILNCNELISRNNTKTNANLLIFRILRPETMRSFVEQAEES
jgi:hypothetical protein